jgi:predicted nucleotidyltransferase
LNNEQLINISNYFTGCPVLKAWIFGSYVRGDADIQSDIDILVDLDYSQRIGLQFIKMKQDLAKILNKDIDLVTSNGLSEYIKPLIDNEKKLIYERKTRG